MTDQDDDHDDDHDDGFADTYQHYSAVRGGMMKDINARAKAWDELQDRTLSQTMDQDHHLGLVLDQYVSKQVEREVIRFVHSIVFEGRTVPHHCVIGDTDGELSLCEDHEDLFGMRHVVVQINKPGGKRKPLRADMCAFDRKCGNPNCSRDHAVLVLQGIRRVDGKPAKARKHGVKPPDHDVNQTRQTWRR